MPRPPRRRRVSRAVRPPRFGAFSRTVRPALRLIDAVHRDGNLPTIAVRPLADPPGGDTQGQYWPGIGETVPVIELWRGCGFPWVVCIHEIGHFLDDRGFALPADQWASEASPLLQQWRDVVSQTRVCARLRSLRSLPQYRVTDANGQSRLVCFEEVILGNGTIVERPVDVDLVRYAGAWRELFARSYVQYIVRESGDARLMEQFMQVRVGESVVLHWDEDDFLPVHAAIDDLMRLVGWR